MKYALKMVEKAGFAICAGHKLRGITKHVRDGSGMKQVSRYFLTVCLPLVLLSCDSNLDQDALSRATNDIKETFKHGAKQLSDLAPSKDDISTATDEEVSKLFSFEYKVLELNKDLGAINIEAELNILGRDRWECFDIEATNEVLTFYCRRRPKTYLRYVPRFFP